jgi:glutamate 5-kinase
LLAVGVRGVLGAFASGQAVRICILKGDCVPPSSQEAAREKYAKGLGLTRPGTPNLTELASAYVAAGEEGSSAKNVPLPEDDVLLVDKGIEYTEADLIEVGRGLANYNSAQIARIKGLNRCAQFKT